MRTVDDAALEANFSAVKSVVGCDQVAELETVLRQTGGHKRGTCPLPDHDSNNPTSFVTTLDSRGFFSVWHCFSCGRGGDVIDLYAAMFGLEHNLRFAMEALAERFGLNLWKPTDFMSDNQLATRKARLAAQRLFGAAIGRHYFKTRVMPLIEAIEDEYERKALLDECLRAAGFLAKGD